MEKEPKPFSEEKAKEIMKEQGLEERSQEAQDAFEAGMTSHREAILKIEETRQIYSKFLMAYNRFEKWDKGSKPNFTGEIPSDIVEAVNEADQYVDTLPIMDPRQFHEFENDPRFINFNPCPGGKRCQDFLILKQEYWGDDMGRSIIEGKQD